MLTRVISDSCCIVHCDKGEAERHSKQRTRQAKLKAHSSCDRLCPERHALGSNIGSTRYHTHSEMKQAEHAIDIAEQTSVITTELTVQSAECEDGMPPESTIARMSHTPCLIFFVKICVQNSSAHQEMPHHVRLAHTAPQHHHMSCKPVHAISCVTILPANTDLL